MSVCGFNPHTHEGCDFQYLNGWHKTGVSIHTPTKGVTLYELFLKSSLSCFNPHTHEGCDGAYRDLCVRNLDVSIHTPTKGVTRLPVKKCLILKFQSTHPRRVWHQWVMMPLCEFGFNPHTHEGCDIANGKYTLKQTEFQSTHPRRVWLYVARRFFATKGVSIHTPTKGVTSNQPTALQVMEFQSTHPRRVWLMANWE